MEALADCLETMRSGEADMKACLDRYPAYRAELKALLEVASLIRPLPDDVTPPPAFREAVRASLAGLLHERDDPAFNGGGEPVEGSEPPQLAP